MHYHNRISKRMGTSEENIFKDNLVQRGTKERQTGTKNQDTDYDSYVNFVKSELMNNDKFKIKILVMFYKAESKSTNMDKDVQKHYKIV